MLARKSKVKHVAFVTNNKVLLVQIVLNKDGNVVHVSKVASESISAENEKD